jgi:hypothetical protein
MRPSLPSRRAALAAGACLCSVPFPAAAILPGLSNTLLLPLREMAGGVLTTGLFIDGEPFRVIVDTGSPYLVVPLDECESQPQKLSSYGCAAPGQFRDSRQPATSEQYGALPGKMQWLTGEVTFGETDLQMEADGSLALRVRFALGGVSRGGGQVVFGGADRAVMSQSGGALLGLISEVNASPRAHPARARLVLTGLPPSLYLAGQRIADLDHPARRPAPDSSRPAWPLLVPPRRAAASAHPLVLAAPPPCHRRAASDRPSRLRRRRDTRLLPGASLDFS